MTGDLDLRLKRHNEGTASGFTRHRRPVTLAYSEETPTWLDASAREQQIKRWTRAKKEALAAGNTAALRGLSRRR
jgi:predicted GIY-YIG superfamily endonuclease